MTSLLIFGVALLFGFWCGWRAGQDAWDQLDAENRELRDQLIDQWVDRREGL